MRTRYLFLFFLTFEFSLLVFSQDMPLTFVKCNNERLVNQNDTVKYINNIIELTEQEGLDTVILKNIVLRFDTIFIVNSPVKYMFTDTTSKNIKVFYNKQGIRKIFANKTWYYFDNEKLIMTYFICMNDFAHMGLCNGLYSEFRNYFVNETFYKTVEGFGAGQCHCSDNIIIDAASIDKIIFKFNEQQ